MQGPASGPASGPNAGFDMRGLENGSKVALQGHLQTGGPGTDRLDLDHRPQLDSTAETGHSWVYTGDAGQRIADSGEALLQDVPERSGRGLDIRFA